METKSLYDQQVYQEVLDRIDKLAPETAPQWGKMNSGQMLAHNAEVIEVSNGKPLENTPFLTKLLKGYIKKMVVGPKPYPKNSRTHPQYVQTGSKDFQREKSRLLDALEKLKQTENQPVKHTLFGTMTKEEKGWAMYKHLVHHLEQFGV